ncbi:MAG: hypothetical protein OSB62_06290 [Alphaproteobacteria bacterium]|nr:hypothetical protein [Alphaproteobacteria bacterium]
MVAINSSPFHYLLKANDDTYIVVPHEEGENYGIGHIYIGKLNETLKALPVTNVRRFRDGGTTYVETAEGTLFIPSPYKGGEPTWMNATVSDILAEAEYYTLAHGMATSQLTRT